MIRIAACSLFLILPATSLAQAPPSPASSWLAAPDMPERTTFYADDSGKFTRCLPPDGYVVTSDFDTNCRKFLADNKKTRSMVPLNKRESWVSAKDIPFEVADRNQGTMSYALLIGINGRAQTCEVTVPSGVTPIDQAICAAIIRKARFRPAIDRDGHRVAKFWRGRYSWRRP